MRDTRLEKFEVMIAELTNCPGLKYYVEKECVEDEDGYITDDGFSYIIRFTSNKGFEQLRRIAGTYNYRAYKFTKLLWKRIVLEAQIFTPG